MEKNKKYNLIKLLSIYLIFFICCTNKEMKNDKNMNASEYQKSISFVDINQNVFIKTRIWGISGNNYQIFLSKEEKNIPNENQDIIFYELEIYYKKKNTDSLLIYYPSNSFRIKENTKIGNINIVFNKFMYSQSDEYKLNYKNWGLKRISVYDGID